MKPFISDLCDQIAGVQVVPSDSTSSPLLTSWATASQHLWPAATVNHILLTACGLSRTAYSDFLVLSSPPYSCVAHGYKQSYVGKLLNCAAQILTKHGGFLIHDFLRWLGLILSQMNSSTSMPPPNFVNFALHCFKQCYLGHRCMLLRYLITDCCTLIVYRFL